ncbi:hypothetical protein FOMPIDRAFT_92444 [Fomitopsis schrenkii]|uniref:Uncharacterized protein n=1 Tax=Fomitopsis schrenkii TaxID=2126942 RepID=S8FDA4_FOMSC|nr:hypothetical protein FOMPIDRAFT_92444 [Fomitopsis schrenkii]
MAYSTYADNTGSVYPYYSSGTSVSPVQDEYAAGEVSYMNDNQRTHWQAQPTASSSYSTSSYAPSSSSHSMPYPPAYTQSPHHQAVSDAYLSSPSSSSRTYAASAPSQTSASSTPTLPNLERAAWAPGTALYIVEHDPENVAATGPTYAQVKTEEEDYEGGFIFELASDAPPVLPLLDNMPQVPLRATHAPKEMRKLMGSFRLDPFAMHNGVKSAASQSVPLGIEVGPLRHPPVMFEWQIELAYPLAPRSPQWSPEAQGLHAFEDDDEKWEQAMDVYSDVFDDDEGMQDPDIPFQTVMTPAQAVGWTTVGYSDTQSIVSTSSSPSGYPVQPLSGMFNRSGQASSSQASISRSLPSLPQPQSSALYRHTQPYPVLSPTSAVPSPPLPHPVYAQRSAPSSAQEIYYRQQQQNAAASVSPPSSSMRISALMSSSSATAVPSISMRRTQLEYPQAQAQAHPHANSYASPSTTSFAGAATGPQQRYRGAGASAPEESMGWYRRPAFALEPYITSACT